MHRKLLSQKQFLLAKIHCMKLLLYAASPLDGNPGNGINIPQIAWNARFIPFVAFLLKTGNIACLKGDTERDET